MIQAKGPAADGPHYVSLTLPACYDTIAILSNSRERERGDKADLRPRGGGASAFRGGGASAFFLPPLRLLDLEHP